jgi:outer membrane protein assembly factor BamD
MSVVATLYPNSPYAPSARWFLAAIRNTLAAHEMTVIRYYYDRHAYLAAANRAGYIVQNFQGSNQTIPALAIMYLSYKNLGLNQQASDAWRVLQLNAPQVANKFLKQSKYKFKNKKPIPQTSA